MKKLGLKLSTLVIISLFFLAGCQKSNQVPAATAQTEKNIQAYVQQVNRLYVDAGRTKVADLSTQQKTKTITKAQALAKKIKPNLYMSALKTQDKKDFTAAQKALKKVTRSTSTTTTKKPKTKKKTGATDFFDADGILKTNVTLGSEADYAGHPKQLAAFKEAQHQQAAIAAVDALFTNSEHKAIPATLTTANFTDATTLVNQSTHKKFKTRYLALIQTAKSQFDTYTNSISASTTAASTSVSNAAASSAAAASAATVAANSTAAANATAADTTQANSAIQAQTVQNDNTAQSDTSLTNSSTSSTAATTDTNNITGTTDQTTQN